MISKKCEIIRTNQQEQERWDKRRQIDEAMINYWNNQIMLMIIFTFFNELKVDLKHSSSTW